LLTDATTWHERGSDRLFYIAVCVIAWTASVGGFLPGFIDFVNREVPYPPLIMHIHAALFMGWLVFLSVQIVLIERGGLTGWHRRLGRVGAVWAVAMVVVTLLMCPGNAIRHLSAGTARPLFEFPLNLADMIVFSGLIASAIALRERPAAHRRLIVLASLLLLDGGCARLLNPLVGQHWLPGALGVFQRNFLWVDLLVLACLFYDRVTRGRIHPVHAKALPPIILLQILACALSASTIWQAAALRWAGS
jgi:hypothetical protein